MEPVDLSVPRRLTTRTRRSLATLHLERCGPVTVQGEYAEPMCLLTKRVLHALGLAPVENGAHSHCFWVASASHTPPAVVASTVEVVEATQQNEGFAAEAWSLCTTPAEQIAVVVTVLRHHYADDLFRPSLPPAFLAAMDWAQAFPK